MPLAVSSAEPIYDNTTRIIETALVGETMKKTNMHKAISSCVGVLISILLFFSSGIKLPLLDARTDDYFRVAISKAGIAYATCRVINASVSMLKASSLQLQPAGVGVSLAIGQALDPIDDMTERVSDVIITAITSLGVQKLAYEISVSLVPPIISVFLFIWSILLWFEHERLPPLRRNILRFLLLVAIARLCLPISAAANAFVHTHFFAEQISAANKALALGTVEIDKLKDFSLPEIAGVLGTIENSTSFLKRKSVEFKNALVAAIENAGDIIENLLKLTFLYVGIFLIQVVMLPVLSFWLMAKTISTLFQINIP